MTFAARAEQINDVQVIAEIYNEGIADRMATFEIGPANQRNQ